MKTFDKIYIRLLDHFLGRENHLSVFFPNSLYDAGTIAFYYVVLNCFYSGFKYFQKKVHHPYPLFQSDDPNVDDNIILLDNDQGTKETGVYTHNNYDQDYAEYDYKGIMNGFCLFSSKLLHKF